jgi:Lar family restriction alleviation protein
MGDEKVEIRPCPFCGNEDGKRPSVVHLLYKSVDGATKMDTCKVECPSCGASGTLCRTEAAAIAYWNRRGESE